MKAFKGFDKNLKCRGFQYEVGKEYEEDKAELCNSGFHACENPLDVLRYYDPASSRFCEVDIEDNGERGGDSKVCGKHIKIKTEIGLSGLIKAGVKFVLDKVDFNSASTNTGNCSASTNTGNYSASTNTGYRSASTNTGNYSASTNTGNYSASTNTGNYSASTNTGNYSASTNTGDYSASEVGGKGSVAIVTGYKSKAKANIGSAIVIAERGEWDGTCYPLIDIKAAIIDGVKLKADTFYTLKNGKFVEIKE